jgi:hypothetical protein
MNKKDIISEKLVFMCRGCFCYSFGGASVPRKERLSTKRIEEVSLSRYHSVNCAQFSAPILPFLNWNHSRLVLHFPSLERLEVSEWPSRFLFHGLCCIIQWSVCPSVCFVPRVSQFRTSVTPIIRNCRR